MSDEPGRRPLKMRTIGTKMTTVDLSTGKETERQVKWFMLPPAAHLCQVCAWEHDPLAPHNVQTIFYRAAFYGAVGRIPTWADAVAHCPPELAARWKEALTPMGHWSEPPKGRKPVAHLGKST